MVSHDEEYIKKVKNFIGVLRTVPHTRKVSIIIVIVIAILILGTFLGFIGGLYIEIIFFDILTLVLLCRTVKANERLIHTFSVSDVSRYHIFIDSTMLSVCTADAAVIVCVFSGLFNSVRFFVLLALAEYSATVLITWIVVGELIKRDFWAGKGPDDRLFSKFANMDGWTIAGVTYFAGWAMGYGQSAIFAIYVFGPVACVEIVMNVMKYRFVRRYGLENEVRVEIKSRQRGKEERKWEKKEERKWRKKAK